MSLQKSTARCALWSNNNEFCNTCTWSSRRSRDEVTKGSPLTVLILGIA